MKQTVDYAVEIAHLLRSIHKKLKDYLVRQNLSDEYTVPQYLLMHVLYHCPKITLQDLSDKMGLAKSTVSEIVASLEVRGVVVREKPPNNRRKVLISLTPKFLAQEKKLNIQGAFMNKLLKNLAPAELEQIVEALRKLDGLDYNI